MQYLKNKTKQNEKRLIDTENKQVVAREDGYGVGKILKGIKGYKPPVIK